MEEIITSWLSKKVNYISHETKDIDVKNFLRKLSDCQFFDRVGVDHLGSCDFYTIVKSKIYNNHFYDLETFIDNENKNFVDFNLEKISELYKIGRAHV